MLSLSFFFFLDFTRFISPRPKLNYKKSLFDTKKKKVAALRNKQFSNVIQPAGIKEGCDPTSSLK